MNTFETIQVPSQVIHKWQEIVDLLAEVLHVPSALIMKVEPPNIRVFVRSEAEGNPYEKDELACLNTGLYCETVMKTRQLLLVPDALADQEWNANPDIKLGMISYMGVPVAWPNGEIFGTICVLDGVPNEYNELYRKLLFQCREVLQADLKSLQAQTQLELMVLERTAELRRSELYLTEAQRLSRTGSFCWNVSSGQILWSEECFRIYGYNKVTSVTVDMIFERTHPDDLALVRQTISRAPSDGKDFDLEHRLLMPDGAVKHVHVAAHAGRDHADQLEYIGALIDITAAKRAEDELQKAQTDLSHASRVTTLGEMAASIAHEVKQPLGAIAANAAASLRFLDRENPDLAEACDALGRFSVDSNRAGDVIQRVRALANKTGIQKSPLDINDVIEEVKLIFRHEELAHGVALRLELASALPPVLGDRIQLQQVIMNLLLNGMQATSAVAGSRSGAADTIVPSTDRVRYSLRSRILASESSRKFWTSCSAPSSRQNRTGWASAFPSAGRLSSSMAGAYGRRGIPEAAARFNSPCAPLRQCLPSCLHQGGPIQFTGYTSGNCHVPFRIIPRMGACRKRGS